MLKRPRVRISDVRGLTRLAGDATVGVSELAEAMNNAVHDTIARVPLVGSAPPFMITRGITRLIYRAIRASARGLTRGADAALSGIPAADPAPSSLQRDALVAALNGVCGDHLAATDNPLAITMHLRHAGRALDLTPDGLADIAQPAGKLLILIHGLCMNDRQWLRNGHDHGAELAAAHGFTPLYLRYNSGLHISTNGRLLAERLAALAAAWPTPVEEIVIIGHSMGGLVARSACQFGGAAGHAWRDRLSKLVFLASPHHGSRLERIGNKIDRAADINPYSAAIGRLGKLRSAGITDLRHGHLRDEDWQGRDRFDRAPAARPAPLPANVECYVVAVSLGRQHGDLRDLLLGDGLVSLASALGDHADADHTLLFEPERQWIGFGMGHLDVLDRPEVYEKLREWLAAEPESKKDAG